jgi:hypothetical protein
MADSDRPELKDISEALKPAKEAVPEATPTPEPTMHRVRSAIENVMGRAANVTTGGANSAVSGALKHF